MSWLFFLHLSQYNKEEIWCPISSRPQYKESDFCPVTIMHFHHHEFSRSVDPQSFQTHRKCQLFYLSAVSLRVHTSSEPLSASIRFSQSAVRLLLSLLSETDVGAHRIMVNKTTSRMLHLRDFLLYFFCSYSTFNAAVCWKKKTYTKERGTEKKVSVYLHHIPFPKRRRRRRKAMSPLSVWHLSLEDMRTRALWRGLRREDRAFTSTWCKVQRVIIIVLTQSCTFS